MRHGIARVDCEVEQHLLDLPGVSPDLSQVLAEFNVHLNVLSDHAREHFASPFHSRVEAEHLQTLLLLVAEREQLPCQIRSPARGGKDFLQVAPQPVFLGKGINSQLGIGADHHKHVVEVVGNPPGQGADSVHPARLVELRFQFALFAGVSAGTHQAGNSPFAVPYRRDEHVQFKGVPLFAADLQISTERTPLEHLLPNPAVGV
jgi:hypothetical protein